MSQSRWPDRAIAKRSFVTGMVSDRVRRFAPKDVGMSSLGSADLAGWVDSRPALRPRGSD
jgi:hypothetical protein